MQADYEDREQSEIKHFVLRKYLEAATLILGPSRTFRYVDCCAGPWNSRHPNFSDTSFGIAYQVLQHSQEELLTRGIRSRASCLFIEKRKKSFALLSSFSEMHSTDQLKLNARNWDFSRRVSDVVNFAEKPGAFAFTFIDPTGWKLAGIPTIESLLKIEPGEVLINFMSSFVTRFLKMESAGLSEILGGDTSHLMKLYGPELESAVVQHYCDQIRKVGKFKYVCSLPVMKAKSESIHFHLIYATRHPKGVKVFKDVERRTERETRVVRAEVQKKDRENRKLTFDLFDAAAYYREDRYREFTSSNHGRARSRVVSLIEHSKQVSYDQCWAEALQFASVYEADLRSWLLEMENDAAIEIIGRKTEKEILKTASRHFIKRVG